MGTIRFDAGRSVIPYQAAAKSPSGNRFRAATAAAMIRPMAAREPRNAGSSGLVTGGIAAKE